MSDNSAMPIEQEEKNLDLYHNPKKLVKVADWSGTLSWVILAFYAVITVGLLGFILMQASSMHPVMTGVYVGVILLFSALPGLVLFILLQALGEVIYLFMDIEDNTRPR